MADQACWLVNDEQLGVFVDNGKKIAHGSGWGNADYCHPLMMERLLRLVSATQPRSVADFASERLEIGNLVFVIRSLIIGPSEREVEDSAAPAGDADICIDPLAGNDAAEFQRRVCAGVLRWRLFSRAAGVGAPVGHAFRVRPVAEPLLRRALGHALFVRQ